MIPGRREAQGAGNGFDYILLGAVIMLSSLGLVMVMSASGIMAEKVFGDKYALFWKQGLFMALGFGILLTTMRANMEFFYRRTYFWILLAAALLLLTRLVDRKSVV